MATPNETTSLLSRSLPANVNRPAINHRYRSSPEEDYGDEVLEVADEPIDILASRFVALPGSIGLSGGVDIFGTSLPPKGAGSFSSDTLQSPPSATNTIRRQPNGPKIQHSTSQPGSRRASATQPLLHKKLSRISRIDGIPFRTGGEVERGESTEKQPEFLNGITKSQARACFMGVLLTWFVASFDSTLMASSHPVITSYFDASNSASWLSTSFLLTSTAFQPMFGRISDTFGRRTPFLFSLLAFVVGTAWCAAADSILQFILARAVCGLAAGGAGSLGSIVVGDMIPLHRRGSYLAIMNLAYGTGTSLGAALGGFLAEALGWRWEFGIQIPIIILCFVVVAITVPPGLGPYLCANSDKGIWHTIRGFDLAGSLLLTASVTFLILALNLGGNVLDWNDPLIITSFVLFGVLAVILVRVERRAEKPVMPMHLLAQIPRGNLVFGNFLFCMTLNTILFNVPLYFQATLLDSPTRSGLRLVIPFVLNMVGAFITGNLINRTKHLKPTLITGSIFLVLGSVFLTSMTRGLPSWSYSWLIGAATLGQGFAFPTINIAILAVTHTDDMAVATSTLILFRSLGTVMGVAVSSLISQNALLYFLERNVVGPDSKTVIEDVRKSVEAIIRLQPVYREQVIAAYAAALKATFAQGIFTAVLGLLLVTWIRLPRLSAK